MNWEAWKERNADWWEPLVAVPLIMVIALFMAVFWLPLLGASYLRITRS